VKQALREALQQARFLTGSGGVVRAQVAAALEALISPRSILRAALWANDHGVYNLPAAAHGA
jgi:hypothetical protein